MSTSIKGDFLENLESSGLIIPYSHLRIFDSLGQGMHCTHMTVICITFLAGEFGIVYKAHLFNEQGMPTDVAVKTLKGQWVSSNKQ